MWQLVIAIIRAFLSSLSRIAGVRDVRRLNGYTQLSIQKHHRELEKKAKKEEKRKNKAAEAAATLVTQSTEASPAEPGQPG